MRTYSTKRGASMPKDKLDAYGVGLMRLKEMFISAVNFSAGDIEFIGQCSIDRREIVLGKIGNSWGVRGMMSEQMGKASSWGFSTRFRAYWVVKGKRVTALRPHYKKTAGQLMDAFECRGNSRHVDGMSAVEIFTAAKGKRPSRRHAAKPSFSTRLAYAARAERL